MMEKPYHKQNTYEKVEHSLGEHWLHYWPKKGNSSMWLGLWWL